MALAWSPLLLSWLLVLAGCSRGPAAPAVDPAANALAAAERGEVDRALAEARALPAGEARDLLFSELTRRSGRDLCDEVERPTTRAACRTDRSRTHLRIEGLPSEPPPSVPLGPLPAGCDEVSPALVESCLVMASRRMPVADAERACVAVPTAARRGDCWTGLAVRTLRNGDAEAARERCVAIDSTSWRGECFFRLSEASGSRPRDWRLSLCDEAGRFRRFCLVHEAERTARATLAALPPTAHYDLALDALREAADELDSAAAELAPGHQLGRTMMASGMSLVFQRGGVSRDLALWAARLERTGDATPQEQALLLRAWGRGQAEAAPARGLAEWEARMAAALARPPLSPPEAALAFDRPDRHANDTPGPWPPPLDPDLGCQLDPQVARVVALLWGLGPQAWEPSRPLLLDALGDPRPAVRFGALWQLQEKALRWREGDAVPSWATEAVARGAAEDAVLQRAFEAVLTSLQHRREAGLTLPRAAMCGD